MLRDDELPPLPDYLSPGTVREYGRAVEAAAYVAAIKACIGMAGTVQCAEAIRSLMEQSK